MKEHSPLQQFHIGTHPEHGIAASAHAGLPAHIADWYLVRLQFETVPDRPGLYRLSDPDRDGLRRARQAVHDLRVQGLTIQADYILDTEPEPSLPERLVLARQTRLARAAAARSPQLRTTPAANPAPVYAAVPAAPSSSRPGTGGPHR
ncbi:hypothetical protein GCM10010232_50080 [Streptomyces amakusaensis]|uniref:Uncharacterized protein n=1 Tax=Streptomyces amakusaensis TaxID=67271 RepID=A0ABW0ALR1_9ACTN